jgi:O-antigen/teichoic acid export membrane protein
MAPSDLNSSLTSVAKGATIIFGGMIAGTLLGMVNQIILGRYLGPENYGLFNLSMSVVMIAATLSVFGLFGSLSRFIPYHIEKNERHIVRSVIDVGFLFSFSLGVVFAIAIYMLAGRLAVGIFHDAKLEPVLKIFAFVIPLHGIQQVVRGIVRGFKAAKYDAILFNIGTRIVTISVFLVSLLFVHRLYGAVIAFISGVIVTTVVAIWIIRKKIFPDYGEHRRTSIARNLLSFSWPLALTGFTYLFVSKTDKVLLGYFMSSRDVGIYTPALMIANLLIFISTAFKYIFLPTVSEYFSKNDIRGLEPLFKSTSKWNFLVVLPLFLFILIFPKEILAILYGSSYTGGYLALIILSLGIAANDFAGTSATLLVAGGRTKLNLTCEIIAGVTNVFLNIVLIPVYGIVGAAIATGISFLTRNISSLSFAYRSYGIHPYTKKYLNIIVSGLVGSVAVYLLKNHSPLSWWATMFILGVVFIAIYLAAILFSRSLDQNDRVILVAIEKRMKINLGFIKKFI